MQKMVRLGLVLLPALSGCLSHHRTVLRVAPTTVQDATVEQLVQQVNAQFDGIQALNASVEIAASVGGSSTGRVTDYTTVNGYIVLRKPADLRIILLVPVLHTTLLDMVSNGKNFKMLIKPKSCAIEGNEVATLPPDKPGSAATLCNSTAVPATVTLWPQIFRDSLLIPGAGADDLVSLTSDIEILLSDDKKHATELPDYDLNILRRKGTSNELQTLRVIHVNRTTLLPYRQDIYDSQGRLATTVFYDGYKAFGDRQFPTVMTIKRPLEEYQIKMTVNKLTLNQKVPDDQFELNIPDNIPLQKMQ